MGLHVGGIFVKVKNGVTQDTVVEFVCNYYLALGAKQSKKDPLKFETLNLAKSGDLGIAILSESKGIDNEDKWINIFDSERYSYNVELADAISKHFDTDVWGYEIVDSVNQGVATKYGKKIDTIENYGEVLHIAESTNKYGVVYFDNIKSEVGEKKFNETKFLSFEKIPHRPNVSYSGPNDKRLQTNERLKLAKKLWKERDADALNELVKEDGWVYLEFLRDGISRAIPDDIFWGSGTLDLTKKKDQEFLYKLSPLTFDKSISLGSTVSVVENALRMKDEKMFEKALKNIPDYAINRLSGRANSLFEDGERYLAFRLSEARCRKTDDPFVVNNTLYYMLESKVDLKNYEDRIRKLIERAEKLAPEGPTIYHNLALYYASIKDRKRAIDAVREAKKYGYLNIEELRKEKELDFVRGEERFKQIFEKEIGIPSLDYLKINRHVRDLKKKVPYIVPTVGLHLYFKKGVSARRGAAKIMEELMEEFPEMFNHYLPSGHVRLSPTKKGKVARDLTKLKKGGSKYGYIVYYNGEQDGAASDLRFFFTANSYTAGEFSLNLPLSLAGNPEKLKERFERYVSMLPFVSGDAGYSLSPVFFANGPDTGFDHYTFLRSNIGLTISREAGWGSLAPGIFPNWLTFIDEEFVKKIDLKKLEKLDAVTKLDKGIMIRASESLIIGHMPHPKDLGKLPEIIKILDPILPESKGMSDINSFHADRNEMIKDPNFKPKYFDMSFGGSMVSKLRTMFGL